MFDCDYQYKTLGMCFPSWVYELQVIHQYALVFFKYQVTNIFCYFRSLYMRKITALIRYKIHKKHLQRLCWLLLTKFPNGPGKLLDKWLHHFFFCNTVGTEFRGGADASVIIWAEGSSHKLRSVCFMITAPQSKDQTGQIINVSDRN